MAEMNLTKVVLEEGDRTTVISYDASDFRTFWDSRCKTLLHEQECRIIRNLLPPSGRWFIDLGCGFGRLAPTYLDPSKSIVAVDYSIRQLEIAQEICSDDNIFYIAADACHLPFRNGVFQSGICIRLFHHIASAETLFREMSRIFADDGHCVFNYMNKRNLLRTLRYGRKCFNHDHEEIHKVLFATHPKFTEQLALDHGFQTVRWMGTGFVHQITKGCRPLERLIDRVPSLIHFASIAEKLYGLTFGRLQLALMQYSLLRRISSGSQPQQNEPSPDFLSILQCPSCLSPRLYEDETGIQCMECARTYPRKNRIYDFRLP